MQAPLNDPLFPSKSSLGFSKLGVKNMPSQRFVSSYGLREPKSGRGQNVVFTPRKPLIALRISLKYYQVCKSCQELL